MDPFYPADYPAEAFDVDWQMRHHAGTLTREQAEYAVNHLRGERLFKNSRYTVAVRDANVGGDWPAMWHLSIKRNDKRVFRDWRHLQEIKNMIVGPENEGIELFPAESRLTDSANQYHLWVLKDASQRFPFGWLTRFVGDAQTAALVGARQRDRPNEPETQPAALRNLGRGRG